MSSYPNRFNHLWGYNSIPTLFIVGRNGRIAREIPGEFRWDDIIARELAQPGR